MATDAWLTLLDAAQQSSSTRPWHVALKACGSAEALVAAGPRLLADKVGPEALAKLAAPDGPAIERWRKWLERPNRALVTFGSGDYPPRLAETADAPLALWVEGRELELLKAPQLAIVGSRSPTTDGRQTAEQFARHLAQRGLTITSGLATGIDGASLHTVYPRLVFADGFEAEVAFESWSAVVP